MPLSSVVCHSFLGIATFLEEREEEQGGGEKGRGTGRRKKAEKEGDGGGGRGRRNETVRSSRAGRETLRTDLLKGAHNVILLW